MLQTAGGLWLAKADPNLLKDRTGMRPQSGRDKAASAVLLLSILVWVVMIRVDVFRLRLLPTTYPNASLAVGGALFALGATLNIWVMKVNSFGATTVKVQEDRGQYVVDTVPYAVVRHPMYSSFMILLSGMALVMESVAMALAAVPLVVLGFLPRILVEEATLRRGLSGYPDYMKRVRARGPGSVLIMRVS